MINAGFLAFLQRILSNPKALVCTRVRAVAGPGVAAPK